MEVNTNEQKAQVETTDALSNAATTVTPDENLSYDDAKDKAFDAIDLDNPDMSLFAEESNVMVTPEQPIVENEQATIVEEQSTVTVPDQVVETPGDENPFAVDEDGFLVRPLIDRGVEIKVTPEELFSFGNKGTNFERKNADAKTFKEHINVLKSGDISLEDLQSLTDLANGNKDAVKHLISKYGVDMDEVQDSEAEYTPDVSKHKVDEVQDIWTDYQKFNPDVSEKVSETFSGLDDGFKREVYKADKLPLFMDDVKNGIFDQLHSETQKIKALHPEATWLQAYSEANRRFTSRKTKTIPTPDVIAPLDTGTPTPSAQTKADDIWDTPGAFEEMTKQLNLN